MNSPPSQDALSFADAAAERLGLTSVEDLREEHQAVVLKLQLMDLAAALPLQDIRDDLGYAEAFLTDALQRQCENADPLYRRRIVETTLSELWSAPEPGTPELQIVPAPADPPARIDGLSSTSQILVLIADDTAGLLDEIFPIMQLEHRRRSNCGIVAALTSWIRADGRLERGIFYGPSFEELIEIPLQTPLLPQSARFLALSRNESREHARWSAVLRAAGVRQENGYELRSGAPASAAALAEDKLRTGETLARAGLPAPPAWLWPASPQQLRQAGESSLFRLQPRYGTEGRNHRLLDLEKDNLSEVSLPAGDWIVRPEIGDGIRPDGRRLTLRLNVDPHGQCSGFWMIGTPGSITSNGGSIRRLDADDVRHLLNDDARQRGRDLARAALQAINTAPESQAGQLAVAGVDLEPVQGNHGIDFVILEVNPRPTGWRHARSF